MSYDEVEKVVENLLKVDSFDSVSLDFHGGEPLLEFGIIKKALENYGDEEKLDFGIQTNGTLLDEDKLDFLIENDVGIGISIDGPREIHNKFRPNLKGNGTFERVRDSIDLMKERDYRVNIISVGTKETLKKRKEYVDFLKEINPSSFQINPLHSLGRGSELEDYILAPKQYAELIKYLMEQTSRLNSEDYHIRMSNARDIINSIVSSEQPYRCMRSPCGAGVDMIGIKKDGVYACAEMLSFEEFRLGDTDESIDSLMKDSVARKLRDTTVEDRDSCKDCAFKYFCGGGCKARAYDNFGTVNAPSRLCEYYKEIFPWTMFKMYEEGWESGYL